MKRWCLIVIVLLWAGRLSQAEGAAPAPASAPAAPASAPACGPALSSEALELLRQAAAGAERVWQNVQAPPARMDSRSLYAYALVLAETHLHPERLEKLFTQAAAMQDRQETSRTYGNFHWYWSDTKVVDQNAVEFCMQAAGPLWLRHAQRLSPPARAVLKETLEHAARGCLGHRVNPSYTNIALMNAQNLLLLGRALGRAELSDEGSRRLDRVCLDMHLHGVHEYVSPTYYGVNLDCLLLIEALADRPRAVEQARALLELLWTDIAANWYAPARRLGGTRSRDYDYLRGIGMLDINLTLAGWLPGPPPRNLGVVLPLLGRWKPPASLQALASRYPRTVRQVWGPADVQSRTHYVLEDVSLSVSSANYHNMDLPLTADLGADRNLVRCVFIPDGRHDPYGRNKILETGSGHMKALHLRPFWTGTMDRTDALGLALYAQGSLPPETRTLESHFVMPREVDGVWAAGRRVELAAPRQAAKAEQVVPLGRRGAVVIRKGTAAVGVKVVFATDPGAREIQAELVNDGNPHGAIRVTVRHFGPAGPESRPAAATTATTRDASPRVPAAAFWVRVAGGLTSDEAFERWRREFEAADAEVRDSGGEVAVPTAAGGHLRLALQRPGAAAQLLPAPSRAVLEVDGVDLGRAILGRIEPIRTWARALEGPEAVIRLPAGGSAAWEAEAGALLPGFETGADAGASGGRFVWPPGEKGQSAPAHGGAVYRVHVARAGTYWLWGRVQAPTSADDSFRLAVRDAAGAPLLEPTDWATGVRPEWTWVRFERGKARAGLDLPAGECRLEILPREDGTRLDRLLLTADPKERPQ